MKRVHFGFGDSFSAGRAHALERAAREMLGKRPAPFRLVIACFVWQAERVGFQNRRVKETARVGRDQMNADGHCSGTLSEQCDSVLEEAVSNATLNRKSAHRIAAKRRNVGLNPAHDDTLIFDAIIADNRIVAGRVFPNQKTQSSEAVLGGDDNAVGVVGEELCVVEVDVGSTLKETGWVSEADGWVSCMTATTPQRLTRRPR